jgi:hypothetical protein
MFAGPCRLHNCHRKTWRPKTSGAATAAVLRMNCAWLPLAVCSYHAHLVAAGCVDACWNFRALSLAVVPHAVWSLTRSEKCAGGFLQGSNNSQRSRSVQDTAAHYDKHSLHRSLWLQHIKQHQHEDCLGRMRQEPDLSSKAQHHQPSMYARS